ncbi:MAG: Lrp/AsnC ligand binding domain-containing protein [Thermoplasmata archaeon]
MSEPSRRQLTLYVESKKAVTTFYRPTVPATGVSVGSAPVATTAETRGADDSSSIGDPPVFFLSDDQAQCVALVEEVARRRGYSVKVVDVAKAGRIERLVTEHLRGVSQMPALVTPGGLRIEGCAAFTEEKLAEIMPTDLPSVRAFTYLKIKGGDLDAIRESLVAFPQVMELHFLAGDWDMLVVLEFPEGPAGRKREVLDFVTERIRSIPQILDTSTLVPEFTITKFPIKRYVKA